MSRVRERKTKTDPFILDQVYQMELPGKHKHFFSYAEESGKARGRGH